MLCLQSFPDRYAVVRSDRLTLCSDAMVGW